MSPYLQHARRHLPGGTDPLDIAVGDQDWMLVSRFNAPAIPSDGASHGISLDPAQVDTSWDTSDSTLFGLADSGLGVYGPEFKQNGLFIVYAWVEMGLTSAPAAGAAGMLAMTGNNYVIAGARFTPWLQDPHAVGNYRCTPSFVGLFNMPAGPVTPPVTRQLSCAQSHGSSSGNIQVSLLALKVNTNGSLSLDF